MCELEQRRFSAARARSPVTCGDADAVWGTHSCRCENIYMLVGGVQGAVQATIRVRRVCSEDVVKLNVP